jgi:hypothetical protein
MARILELEETYFVKQIIDKAHAFAIFNYYPPPPVQGLILSMVSGLTLMAPF